MDIVSATWPEVDVACQHIKPQNLSVWAVQIIQETLESCPTKHKLAPDLADLTVSLKANGRLCPSADTMASDISQSHEPVPKSQHLEPLVPICALSRHDLNTQL